MQQPVWAERIIAFNVGLELSFSLPDGVEILSPYAQPETRQLSEAFYQKFYNDTETRRCILGINPGRFGGGLTGVPFTDPSSLKTDCGIPNELPQKSELSAAFMRQMILQTGGLVNFYKRFYITAVCPIGLIKQGNNTNYYELPSFKEMFTPYIVEKLWEQLTWPIDRSVAYCIGEGKNYQYLQSLNRSQHFFNEIIPLPHPRFIMQYRRRRVDEYIQLYADKLGLRHLEISKK